MVALARRCFREGALGLSTSQAHTHNDGAGQPVPSRAASRAELEALAASLAERPGTTLELIVAGCINGFSEEEVELMATLSLLAQRPANWNVLGVSALNPGACERQLDASTVAADRGATVVALTLPHTMSIRLSFEHGAILDGLPGWREVFALPRPERMERLADPAVRQRLDTAAHSNEAGILAALANWRNLVIDETFSDANAGLAGTHGGRHRRRARPGAVRRPPRRGPGRPAAYRTATPDPRVGGGLGAAGRRVEGPADGGGGIRCRRPSRHDVRRRLLHLHAGRRGTPARPAQLGGGHPPTHRRAGPPLRPPRPGPGGGRVVLPTWWCWTPTGWATGRSTPGTISPAAPAASTPRPRGSSTCWSTGPRSWSAGS